MLLVFFLAGCAAKSPYNRMYVSQSIEERTDFELSGASEPGEFTLPEGISLSDGLTQDEAVAVALWNNAQFQADLVALGFARADLIEASLLSNPVFSFLFPVGPKQEETKLNLPIDVIWQRPRRIAAAKLDVERISENLVQHGLGLIRNVRTAFADLLLAQEQAVLAGEDAKLRGQIADITRARLRAGDISELEASISRVDSLRAEDAVLRFSNEAILSKYRLNSLLGLEPENSKYEIIPSPVDTRSETTFDELLTTAFAARPDLRAAELAIEAAGKRVGWERSKILNFIGIIDGKDKGEEHITVGPAFQVDIPIMNRNNGNVARAQAELEQAALQYVAVRHSLTLEVQEAYNHYVLVHKEFEIWHSDIVPSLEEAVDQAQKAYIAGEESYLFVLETMRQLSEARMRKAELAADLRRAAAQLSYCTGKKII
ncbi:hypothetical protein AMJ80_09110 [bacterium SM23_31]|nr:MAG: hypothetical protein AMJ80_09110 [bacterium SM23_31]